MLDKYRVWLSDHMVGQRRAEAMRMGRLREVRRYRYMLPRLRVEVEMWRSWKMRRIRHGMRVLLRRWKASLRQMESRMRWTMQRMRMHRVAMIHQKTLLRMQQCGRMALLTPAYLLQTVTGWTTKRMVQLGKLTVDSLLPSNQDRKAKPLKRILLRPIAVKLERAQQPNQRRTAMAPQPAMGRTPTHQYLPKTPSRLQQILRWPQMLPLSKSRKKKTLQRHPPPGQPIGRR